MPLWGDLGHSETGSGETVGRVLKKKKKKKAATNCHYQSTATKRVVGTDRSGDRDSESETVEVETPHTPHTVTQVCTTPPSTQFTFVDVPMFTVHTSTGAEFQTVKSRTRKRATRAADILPPSTRLLFQLHRPGTASRTCRRQPPNGLGGPHHHHHHHHHHQQHQYNRRGAPVCVNRPLPLSWRGRIDLSPVPLRFYKGC